MVGETLRPDLFLVAALLNADNEGRLAVHRYCVADAQTLGVLDLQNKVIAVRVLDLLAHLPAPLVVVQS